MTQEVMTAGQTTSLVLRDEDMRWMTLPEPEVLDALRNSIYPGADLPMVKAVLGYCRVNRLNPMLRPVHIVPMWIPKKEVERDGRKVVVEGTGMMRDVLMPSIGHYRIQAHRTGRYLGLSRPVWGPEREFTFKGGVKMTVPESVAMCVKVKVGDEIVEFWHEEYFLEAYAAAGRDTDAPNAMWFKRGRGQLAKVGEAGALRKGFPELGDYTAEEMEGKVIDLVRQDDGSHAAPAKPAANAASQLDAFSGGQEEVKGSRAGPAKAKPKEEGKPADAEPTALPTEDTGEVLKMDDAALTEWVDRQKWSKAWRWISENMPKLGPNGRQDMADAYADILMAVHKAGASYKKAVEDFAGRMAVAVTTDAAAVAAEKRANG